MEETVPYNLNQLGIRARSKRELYLVLLNDCGVYMPPLQDSNAGYVRGVVTGTVKFIKTIDVALIQVPYLKQLSTQHILDFSSKHVKINEYLPKYKTFRLPNRNWFCNLVNTLLKDKFKKWVEDKMSEREAKLILSRSITANVLPEFSQAFASSKSVSVTHGRSHFLLRNPSNKRRKREESKEILAFDHFEEIKEAEYQTEIYSLKEKINEFKMIQLEDSKYREIVENLIEKGVISRDGEEVIKF